MRYIKKQTKIISAALSITIAISCFPLKFYAHTASASENIKTEEIAAVSDEVTIISEISERREANKKVFLLSDGSYMTAEYPQNIHYSENGEWKDYDNSLSDDSENAEFANRRSDFNIRFSKKSNGKKLVRVKKNGYEISWNYVDSRKSSAKAQATEASTDKTVLNKLTSQVIYENIYKEIDLEYTVLPDSLKENVILKSSSAATEFETEYKANKLTPEQIDSKTIVLKSSNNEIIYTISAPFMEDANGEVNEDVALTLKSVKNNSFVVATSLNKGWLNNNNRKYPVTVDPILKTAQDISAAQSAFVSSANPNKCYLASGTDEMGSLYVGNISGFGQTESYIKFTSLPSLGVADKVIDARLYLALRKCEFGLTVNVKQLSSDWDPYTVKWNNKPTSKNIIKDYMVLTPQTDTTKFQTVEITDLVRGWYSGEYPNYGISLSTDKTSASKAWFYSIHYTGYTAARPIMTVNYRNMSGYEDYWSYTELPAGRGGTVSINNFNGNMVFKQPVTEDTGGNLMPVNLSVIYNSNGIRTQFANLTAGYSYMGHNTQTNYHIYIREDSRTSADGYKYFLHDGDGTRHWFYFENNASIGKDEDGLGYTLEIINVGSDSLCPAAGYRIKDKDGNRMYFNNLGNIIQITNTNNISATVQYETVSDYLRIKSVTDGAGRSYIFGYHPSYPYLLYNITDPAGRKTSFEYYQGTFTYFEFSDGKNYYIAYTEDCFPKIIRSVDDIYTYITYDSSPQKRVSCISSGTPDGNLLEKYSFSYRQNETDVTDIKSRTLTYQFNDYGQTTGTVSRTEGTAVFTNYEKGNQPGNAKANKVLQSSREIKGVANYAINPGFSRDYENGYWKYFSDSTGSPTISIDASKGNLTKNSVKVYKPASNTKYVIAVQDVQNLTPGTYTLSGYVNTGGAALAGNGSFFGIELRNSAGKKVLVKKATPVIQSSGWERVSISFTMPADHRMTFVMGFDGESYGTVWFDDIQLEKGAAANNYNLVEDSAVRYGTAPWSQHSTKTVGSGPVSGENCLTVRGSFDERWVGIHQYISCAGKKGDVYTFGAWVKADSAPTTDSNSKTNKPVYELDLHYYNESGTYKGTGSVRINPDVPGWQFVSGELILPSDASKICIELLYSYNVNTASISGAFVYKEQFGQTYTYDNNGNVISAADLAKANSEFAYNGKQMAQMLTPAGSRYLYNYTADSKKQLYSALSSSGQEYKFKYDSKGNVTESEITARKPVSSLEAGKKYMLVNAYSGLAVDSGWHGTQEYPATVYKYTADSKYQYWQLGSGGENGVFTFKAASFENRYLDIFDCRTAAGTALITYSLNGGKNQKFKPVRQSDGTYVLYTGATDYTKALDGQYDNPTEVIQSQTVKQADCNSSSPKASQRWYFYPAEAESSDKIVSKAEYTQNGNYASKMTDSRGSGTLYNHNALTGTLTNTTDPNGNVTSYTYDAATNALLSVTSGSTSAAYSYEKDRLTGITAGGNAYAFTYDAFGRRTGVKTGSRLLSATEYSGTLVSKQTYGNGNYITYSYDNLDRITEKKYNNDSTTAAAGYMYGANGLLSMFTDRLKNTNTRYTYDLADRVTVITEYSGTELYGIDLLSSVKYNYEDKTNRLSSVIRKSALGSSETGFVYGNTASGQNPDAVYTVKHNGNATLNYTYDALGRLSGKTTAPIGKTTSYTYLSGGHGESSTTTLVGSVTQNGITTGYTYDANGNITEIKENSVVKESYTYDSLNQLKTVTRNNITTSYEYDNNGNITEVKQNGAVIKSYTYGDSEWKDLLTGFNGQSISYDIIGNPLTYRGKAMTWERGRRLAGITEGDNAITYTYDDSGLRLSKTVNGITTEYVVIAGTLAGEISGGNKLMFLYDESGTKYGFIYNGATYYYNLNLQGDVTGIFDSTGTDVVQYTYDEWGKLLSVTGTLADTVGQINPIRYRGYYYDSETGFYYLQSRYYDPETGRFINADGILGANGDILSYNLFAYCSNNPINFSDPSGNWKIWGKIKEKVKGFLKGFTSDYISKSSKVSTAVSTAIITGKNISVGKGWTARIDRPNDNTKTQKHIHVEKGKLRYSQNEDGSKHDGNSSNGSPPSSVKKTLKEKLGWDWDGNIEKFELEHGRDFTQDPMNSIFFYPINPSGFSIPSFAPSSYHMIPIFAY